MQRPCLPSLSYHLGIRMLKPTCQRQSVRPQHFTVTHCHPPGLSLQASSPAGLLWILSIQYSLPFLLSSLHTETLLNSQAPPPPTVYLLHSVCVHVCVFVCKQVPVRVGAGARICAVAHGQHLCQSSTLVFQAGSLTGSELCKYTRLAEQHDPGTCLVPPPQP